jgi:hypothetical protein
VSGKSAQRPNQGLKKFSEILANAAEKARERQQLESGESGESGELPKPKTQSIFDDHFEWVWKPLDELAITASMDRKLQTWVVDFSLHPGDGTVTFTMDEAKAVGDALVACFAWQHVWKKHVADYMLGERTDQGGNNNGELREVQ